MYQVMKRDGTLAEFNIQKIASAITKAFEARERQYHIKKVTRTMYTV